MRNLFWKDNLIKVEVFDEVLEKSNDFCVYDIFKWCIGCFDFRFYYYDEGFGIKLKIENLSIII